MKIIKARLLGLSVLAALVQPLAVGATACERTPLGCQVGLYSIGGLDTDDARGVSVVGDKAILLMAFQV